jgi:hypothetical protein
LLFQAAEQKHDSGDGAGEEDEDERGSRAKYKLQPAGEESPGAAEEHSFSKPGPIEPEAYEFCRDWEPSRWPKLESDALARVGTAGIRVALQPQRGSGRSPSLGLRCGVHVVASAAASEGFSTASARCANSLSRKRLTSSIVRSSRRKGVSSTLSKRTR